MNDQRPNQHPAGSPAAPAHIAIVVAGLGAGGAERVISLLAGAWVGQGRRVTLIAFDGDDAPVFHFFDRRIEIVRLGIEAGAGGLAGLRATWRRYRALRRTLRALQPDVTISFLTKVNVLALLASLYSRRRVIVSERNNPRLQNASGFWTMLLGWLHWRADGIVMQTQASLECLDPEARRRARVIPNPIAIEPIRKQPRPAPILAAAGRLTHQKGFDLLIDAFARIAARHPHWTLVIWGEGPDRAALETDIAGHGLAGRVHLPGNSGSPGEWAGQADAFVLSSRYEGFSNVLGEAMAAGVPVVAFDCKYGPAEMIRPERDGLLVPYGDVPALAAALDRLLGNDELRHRLGLAAAAAAERFRPHVIVARWEQLLAEVMVGPRP